MNGIEKKLKKLRGFGFAAVFLCIVGAAGVQAHAVDNGIIGTLYEVIEDAEVKEEADAASATIGSLEAGTAVILESEEGTWSRVLYQDLEGYVPSGVLKVYAEEELGNLAQEMDGVAEEEERLVEEAELAAKQRRTSMIWGIVGAVLILAIFGIGVVSTYRNTKEEEKLQDGGDVSDTDERKDE